LRQSAHPNISLGIHQTSLLLSEHTLGLPKAVWLRNGLRSIEAGTRARAALLNITKKVEKIQRNDRR
jgi:hypothetical protein